MTRSCRYGRHRGERNEQSALRRLAGLIGMLTGRLQWRNKAIAPFHRSRCTGVARPILSTCAGLSWPSGIDRQCWVGCDLKVGAVVVAVISIPIESVFTHPKDDLQCAILAVDVGKANVGLMK